MHYTPHTGDEIKQMLKTIGVDSVEDLFKSIPSELRSKGDLNIAKGMSELGLSAHLKDIASHNHPFDGRASFLGAGAYRHYIPASVSELASRSEFVTPYTPYQPEISQGTLQTLFEYQSMICRLFDMDVSNASHYSGATALADACLMARRVARKRSKIILPDTLHPEYRDVARATFEGSEDLLTVNSTEGCIDRSDLKTKINDDVAAIVIQYPNFFGIAEDMSDIADLAHDAGALLIAVVPEPLSLGILKPPGTWGADIAVGEGLSFGLPVSFGGPTLGIFTVREKLVRQMPGRLCGKTVDAEGRTSYTLTLSTREQHIRREKATSNICSNQALCASTAAIYLALLGKQGIRELALLNTSLANYAKKRLSSIDGITLPFNAPTFNEFVIECDKSAKDILAKLEDEKIIGGVDLGRWYPEMKNRVLICCTEMNTREQINSYSEVMGTIL